MRAALQSRVYNPLSLVPSLSLPLSLPPALSPFLCLSLSPSLSLSFSLSFSFPLSLSLSHTQLFSSNMKSIPPKKLLWSGFSTPYTPFVYVYVVDEYHLYHVHIRKVVSVMYIHVSGVDKCQYMCMVTAS